MTAGDVLFLVICVSNFVISITGNQLQLSSLYFHNARALTQDGSTLH